MSKGINILFEEYKKIKENDALSQIGGIVNLINKDILHWEARLKGPKSTPFENGLFILEMKFSPSYPYESPLVQMRTPTLHPNINDKNGNICISYLSNQKKDYNIIGILYAIFELLAHPNFDSAYYPSFRGIDKSSFFRKASKMTMKYAVEGQSYGNNWDMGWSNEIQKNKIIN